jgi:hypothetical protein
MSRKGKYGSDADLVTALACGATVAGAAHKYGVSESTVYRRLRNPEFVRRIKAIQLDTLKRTSGMLTAMMPEAAKTLLALQDPAMPPAVRLGASRTTLDQAIHVRKHVDFDERLTALEQASGNTAA